MPWPQKFAASKTRQPKTMLKITFKFLCVFILFGFVCLKAYSDQRHGELTKNLQSDGNNRSIATGFFVTDSGHLITAHHVVKNAKTIQILVDRQRVLTATLLKANEELDLALLQVQAITPFVYLSHLQTQC